MIKEILSESAVGKIGRTGKVDAEIFVKENPQLVDKFKKIVQDIGGKTVAAELLNLKIFGKNPPKGILSGNYIIQPDPATEK